MIDIGKLIKNKYHKKISDYSIEFCKPDQIEQVKDFIRKYWRKDHPVVLDSELMNWQYLDPKTKQYNIVIARLKETDEIHGIYAFIPISQFDMKLPSYQDVWLSIWQISPKTKTPFLGLSLLTYMIDIKNPRSIIGIKSSDIAKSIFRNNNEFKTGFMNHSYIVNKNKKELNLITNFNGKYVSNNMVVETKKIEEINFEDLDTMDVKKIFEKKVVPMKSVNYVKNRFLKHPTFNYKILKVIENEKIVSLIVTRLQTYQETNAIRILDYFGDEKNIIGINFQKILEVNDSEYIDFYNVGISDSTLLKAGFLKRETDSEIIVPNYFNPFERKNIDIDYLYRSKTNVRIFKADSDQDRPNIIK